MTADEIANQILHDTREPGKAAADLRRTFIGMYGSQQFVLLLAASSDAQLTEWAMRLADLATRAQGEIYGRTPPTGEPPTLPPSDAAPDFHDPAWISRQAAEDAQCEANRPK